MEWLGLSITRPLALPPGPTGYDEAGKFCKITMAPQRNLLTVLGCSSSLALMLSVTPSALASPAESSADSDRTLPSLTQADSNPIMDALSCSCARCVMGQTADM